MRRSIAVEVRLYGVLRDYYAASELAPHRPFLVDVAAEANVAEVAAQLMIPVELVAGVAVNGATADLQTLLHEGDQVRLFPPSTGG
ncbi:MAG: MoaD/ThiS family protein [Anaerolineales bacterium]|nr:MoaD/ThiS family protein [Anaerolineales bacterium]MCB8966187.1 MoaD/ThiS family protein [Ardenticatenaceae bacterium]